MKRKKNMLLLLLCLTVLVGATFAVTKLNPDNSTTPTEDTAVTIFTLDTAAVEALEWSYSEDLSFQSTADGWEYVTDPVFPLDESYIEAALESIAQITASRTIEGVEDWDQYGLEVPICTVKVTTDAVTTTLSIGEESGLGGERYFSLGDGNVYLVDSTVIDAFCYGLYDLLTYESIPSMTDVTGIRLESTEQSYSIVYTENSQKVYSDEYVWFMGGKVLDNELTDALITEITSVTWQECVQYNASDLSQYGLDDPTARVTVDYIETVTVDTGTTDDDGNAITETQERDASFTLEIGGTDEDGNRYARIADSNMVYRIDGDLCQTLLYTTYEELQPDDIILLNWDDVTAVEVTLDDTVHKIVKSTKAVTDEDGTETQETVWLLGTTEVDAESIFTALDSLSATGYATGITPTRSQQLGLVFHRESDTFPQVELVFYPYDSTQCLTMLNGEATVFTGREAVAELVEEITQLTLSE